ncbi:MAG: DUF222 domain-containing protein [Acidobacteriota bacterium]|nr:DUF222 domain-containing protein [Acidobacteriota bacterium]
MSGSWWDMPSKSTSPCYGSVPGDLRFGSPSHPPDNMVGVPGATQLEECPVEQAEEHLEALRRWSERLEPATFSADAAARLLDVAGAIERLGAALKLRVVPRALQGASWREEGYRSEAAWLAERTRSSVPQAVAVKTTAERLETLPATAEALAAGALSPLEAQTIAAAAVADPTAEASLLEAAGTLPLHLFTLAAKKTAQAAYVADPGHRGRLHARRFFRAWTDEEGMSRISGALLPEDGLELISAVRSRAAHVADEMRAAGEEPEPQAAYDADALVALVAGDERRATFAGAEGGRSRSPQLVLHVSAEGLRRGVLEDGEWCEVPGVGPVPLHVADSLAGDATLTVLARSGVDVRTVAYLGRTVPTDVCRALAGRDPTCVVPNCQVTVGLEIDHWKVPFSQGGPTALWNLCRLCKFHHRLKTYEGFRLAGGPGRWEWFPPG